MAVASLVAGCQRPVFKKLDVERQCVEYYVGRVPGLPGRPECNLSADGYKFFLDDDGNCWTGTWCDLETAWGFHPVGFSDACDPLIYQDALPLCLELDEAGP